MFVVSNTVLPNLSTHVLISAYICILKISNPIYIYVCVYIYIYSTTYLISDRIIFCRKHFKISNMRN